MTFVSIQEKDFLTAILKTWITLFSNDSRFSGVNVLPKFPDKDVEAKIPCVVVRRVSQDSWKLCRNSGYFGNTTTATPTASVGRLQGYTYKSMYQFDVYATSIGAMNEISSNIYSKLKSTNNSDVFADFRVGESYIPLKDFSSIATGIETDLKIKYNFHKDIDGVDIDPFDQELHQHSISVTFRLDYLKEYEIPKITMISPEYTLLS